MAERPLDNNENSFEQYLHERRLAESTIEFKLKIVRHLSRRFNLWDKDAITQYIRRASWTNRRKNNVSYAYRDWCRWKGYDYGFERYKEEQQPLPYIPYEKELRARGS